MKATLENSAVTLDSMAVPTPMPPPVDSIGQILIPRAVASVPHLALRPQKGWIAIDFRELWNYRELIWMLALRDIRVKYKQTAIGAAWFILSPLITAIIFTLVFGQLAQVPSNGIPFPLFAFAGILLYNLFSGTANTGVLSLVTNQQLISKVYFPRLIFPLAPVATAMVDFSVGCITLVAFMLHYRLTPHWTILLGPIFVLEAALLGFGLGLWLGALNVRYRDVAIAVPFLLQIWLYGSPIAYPLSLAHTKWPHGYVLFVLNPLSGVVEGFRWSVLGGPPIWTAILLAPALIALLVFSGLYFFRRMERDFADLV